MRLLLKRLSELRCSKRLVVTLAIGVALVCGRWSCNLVPDMGSDSGEPRECSCPVGCELDYMEFSDAPGEDQRVVEFLEGKGRIIPDFEYTDILLDRVLWVDDQSDTNPVCLGMWEDDYEGALTYHPFPIVWPPAEMSESLRAYSSRHRHLGWEPLHFIAAMKFGEYGANTTACGCTALGWGFHSYIFDYNILRLALETVAGGWDNAFLAERYEGISQYATTHEMGHHLGAVYECDTTDCVMVPEIPNPVPSAANLRFCKFCSKMIADSVAYHFNCLLSSQTTRECSSKHGGGSLAGVFWPSSTRHRMQSSPPCVLKNGEPVGGLLAFCRVDADTLVIGEPIIVEFGLANVGKKSVRVFGQAYSAMGGRPPSVVIVDPAGYEYRHLPGYSELVASDPDLAVTLSPGDTLKATIQIAFHGHRELLFPFPGRWGIYCEYKKHGQPGFSDVAVASGVSWVDVVEPNALDVSAWDEFIKAKKSLQFGGASSDEATLGAFRNVVSSYAQSAYYRYSLYMYARCLMVGERYEEALSCLTRFRTEYPEALLADEALFDIAQCLHQLQRYEEAGAIFRQAQKQVRWNWKSAERFAVLYETGPPWDFRLLY